MDRTTLEDQIIYRYQRKCNLDPDVDATVPVFASVLPQVSVKVAEEHSTDFTPVATQSI